MLFDILLLPPAIGEIAKESMAGEAAYISRQIQAAKESDDGHLDLANSNLTMLPQAMFLLLRGVNLSTCDLSSNLLTSITPRLCNFSTLTGLDLSNNRLSSLPHEFSQLSSLQRLNLSSNRFETVPIAPNSFPNLRELILAHNEILQIDVEGLDNHFSMGLLVVEGNPMPPEECRKVADLNSHWATRTNQAPAETTACTGLGAQA